MALDYKQSAQLRTNLIFQGRIATAMLKWADFKLLNTAADLSQPVVRDEINYAEEIYNTPNQKAQAIQALVVADPAIQGGDLTSEGDSTVTDAVLQTATEGAIAKVI